MNLDRLYESFVARDLFAKVVPGGILFTTVIWWITEKDLGEIFGSSMHFPFWIWPFIYGVCFVLGFAVQSFGELFGVLGSHAPGETRNDWLGRWITFRENTGSKQFNAIRAASERLAVIKETCGNVALSSLIALAFWVFVKGSLDTVFDVKAAFFTVMALIGISVLFWYHLVIRWRQAQFEGHISNHAHNIVDFAHWDLFRITVIFFGFAFAIMLICYFSSR